MLPVTIAAGPVDSPPVVRPEVVEAEVPKALLQTLDAPVEPLRTLDAPQPAPAPAEPEAPAPAAPPVEPMSAPVELRALDAPEPDEPLDLGKPESRPEPGGSYEIGEHVTGDAEAVILPAGER